MDRSNQKINKALSRIARKRRWAKSFDLGLPDSNGRRVIHRFPDRTRISLLWNRCQEREVTPGSFRHTDPIEGSCIGTSVTWEETKVRKSRHAGTIEGSRRGSSGTSLILGALRFRTGSVARSQTSRRNQTGDPTRSVIPAGAKSATQAITSTAFPKDSLGEFR